MLKKAFTLVELLVVVGIMALLLSVLMPALAKARQQSKAVVCLSNLRQMAIAAHTYASNNNDYYPIGYLSDPNPMDPIAINECWDFKHIKNWDTLEQTVEPGILWQGETVMAIQQCPSFKGDANSGDPYTGYNYNTSFIGHGDREVVKIPARTTEVKNPVQTALFGDGEYYDGANKFMRSPFKSSYDTFAFRAAGTQGYRHSRRTNVVYCDGHAEPQKEYYTETMDAQKEMVEGHNKANPDKIVGFLSPDNSAYDLK